MNAIVFLSFLGALIGFPSVLVAALPQYCASITTGEAAGAKGFVALQIENGVAQYSLELDLAGYDYEAICPNIAMGISYHIHTQWTNATSFAGANSYCGASYTGGHYDPNFACSNSSSAIKTSCVDLQRTWGQGYRYACNTTNYNAGHYSFCEVGDTAAKAGKLYLDSSQMIALNNFIDYQPPYAVNFNEADKDSTAWLSFVFHCAQNSARMICARFSTTQLTACQSAFATFSTTSTDDDNVSQTDFNNAVILSTILCFFGGILIGAVVVYLIFGRGKDEEKSALNKV